MHNSYEQLLYWCSDVCMYVYNEAEGGLCMYIRSVNRAWEKVAGAFVKSKTDYKRNMEMIKLWIESACMHEQHVLRDAFLLSHECS